MIDEKKIINKLENRMDAFIKQHPKEKDSPSVQSIREFIHMLQIEAKEQVTKEDLDETALL